MSVPGERPEKTGWRILVSGGLAVGGPQTHLTVLCRILRQAGAEVTVAAASTNWTPRALTEMRALGVKIVVSPFGFGRWRLLGKAWALLAWPFLLRRDYDVLYCLGEGKMHLWARRFVASGAWTIYHELVECPVPNSVGAQVAGRMDAVVANSRQVGADLTRLLPMLPIRTLPFLTAAAITPRPSRRGALGSGLLRVAFLGRLVSHKRPDLLIESWSKWNEPSAIGPARLDLYGGDYDGEAERLQKRITEVGLAESVRLHGAYTTADLARIFADSDVVVLPSTYEGLPLVLVEAMLHGIPVVATSAGGTAELGENNPDVIITTGTQWFDFEQGLLAMARQIRAGTINGVRLHAWTENRYGFARVAGAWSQALLDPEACFGRAATKATKHQRSMANADAPVEVAR